jgi:hypothetical protein
VGAPCPGTPPPPPDDSSAANQHLGRAVRAQQQVLLGRAPAAAAIELLHQRRHPLSRVVGDGASAHGAAAAGLAAVCGLAAGSVVCSLSLRQAARAAGRACTADDTAAIALTSGTSQRQRPTGSQSCCCLPRP